MIIEMKKVSVVCLESDVEHCLEALRELGAVHLEHAKTSESDELQKAGNDLTAAQRAFEVLELKKKSARKRAPKTAARKPQADRKLSLTDVMETVSTLISRRHELEVRLESLTHEEATGRPFGQFEPEDVRTLAARGVTIKLYHAMPEDRPDAPDGVEMTILSRDKHGMHFALIGEGEIQFAGHEIPLPKHSLDALNKEIENTKNDQADAETQLLDLAVYSAAVAEHILCLEDNLHYLEARAGMQKFEKLSCLRGFCPADGVDALKAAADREGWALLVEDTSEADNVPTLIRNPRWVRPIQSVFDVLGLTPGYKEVDVSMVFLLFFSVFFAMLVGDAAYGTMFLVLTIWMRRKFKDAPPQPFTLLKILSVCTIIWGVMTGTYFGMSNPPDALAKFKVAWLTKESNLMTLCFLMGAVQLTIAHVWNIFRMYPSLLVIDQIGRIGVTWTMYFAAQNMIQGAPFPPAMFYVFGAGLVCIILFMTPWRQFRAEWYNHVMLPLNIISNFVDVVSYVRLFAVGFAGFAIANNFNEMALGSGISSAWAGLGAALILFLGHGLNILLCCMGVLVHGVRLNALEFSGHLNMQWSGFNYRPFAHVDALHHKGD